MTERQEFRPENHHATAGAGFRGSTCSSGVQELMQKKELKS